MTHDKGALDEAEFAAEIARGLEQLEQGKSTLFNEQTFERIKASGRKRLEHWRRSQAQSK